MTASALYVLFHKFICCLRLEVHVTKSEPTVSWSMLIKGDSRGKMVFTEEQLAVINEQLDKFTTSTEVNTNTSLSDTSQLNTDFKTLYIFIWEVCSIYALVYKESK